MIELNLEKNEYNKIGFFSQVFVLLNEKIKRNVQGKNASIFKYKKYKNVNGARNICLKIFKKKTKSFCFS